MGDYKVLIIGYGVVGANLYREIHPLIPSVYDKYKNFGISYDSSIRYDVAFICVDTPTTVDSVCDISEICCAINDYDADIYVIKSTVLPNQTDFLRQLSSAKHIVFSPEYYGNTQHCNNYKFNFTILGGEKEDCIKVQQILQSVYDASHIFRITDAKTVCLAKYMENAYLATKVSFCNQFYEIAEKSGIDYEELRELFILDPRVNPAHTFVYRDHPYWDSHCLNKDVAAIAKEYNAELLENIINYNNHQKFNAN